MAAAILITGSQSWARLRISGQCLPEVQFHRAATSFLEDFQHRPGTIVVIFALQDKSRPPPSAVAAELKRPTPSSSTRSGDSSTRRCRRKRRRIMPRFGKRGAARLGFDTVADLAPFTTPIHVSAQGMLTWKLVPPPTVLSTQMRPLWASTIPLQIASPSPALARDA